MAYRRYNKSNYKRRSFRRSFKKRRFAKQRSVPRTFRSIGFRM